MMLNPADAPNKHQNEFLPRETMKKASYIRIDEFDLPLGEDFVL